MAQWQIFKGKTSAGSPIQVGDQFDDGEIYEPHEAGFSTAAVVAEMATRKGDGWGYMGRSTQLSAAMEPVLAAEADKLVSLAAGRLAQAVIADPDNAISDPSEALNAVLAERGEELAAAARASVLAEYGLNG